MRTISYNTQNEWDENGKVWNLKDVDSTTRNYITELKADSAKWNTKESKRARNEKIVYYFLNDFLYCQCNSIYFHINLIILFAWTNSLRVGKILLKMPTMYLLIPHCLLVQSLNIEPKTTIKLKPKLLCYFI